MQTQSTNIKEMDGHGNLDSEIKNASGLIFYLPHHGVALSLILPAPIKEFH